MRWFGATLVFVAELGMLAGLAWWGWMTGEGALRLLLAVLVPGAVAAIWGTFLAPRAPRPLKPRGLATLLRLDLLLLGAAAAWFADARGLAVATAAMAVIGTVLANGAEQDPNGPAGQH